MRWVLAAISTALAAAPGTVAVAQSDGEVRLFGDPTSYTDIIDAFDEDDPFDLNVRVGFEQRFRFGTIQRETALGPADGRDTANYVDVVDYSHTQSRLELGLDIGIFHDLAIYGRLPIILTDARELSLPSGTTAADVMRILDEQYTTADGTMASGPLFSPTFTSPTRSGLDHIGVGLAWAIFNQYRQPEYPTWLIMVEGEFGIGEPLNACNEDENYGTDPVTGEPNLRCNGSGEAGISEGINTLRLETRASRRYRYVEPYAGLMFQMSWPGPAGDLFEPGGDLSGFINTLPPRIGEFTAGLALIPWEQRARAQRFTIDFRVSGAYISEGHQRSPLFDALGTSTIDPLRVPRRECPDAACNRPVVFTGLTDTESHGRIRGQVAFEMQAAKYVRFRIGGAFQWESPYHITYADSCNPNVSADDPRSEGCRSGIINPHHRPVIDLPGRRFRVAGELGIDLHATIIGQF